MLSGFGDKAGAQIVERGHVVEQHAAGAVGPLNLNADLAADDAAEIAGLVQAAVEPEKAARPAAIAQKAFMQAAAGVVVFDSLRIFPVSSFIEIVQTAKKFFIIRFFTDGIDA